MTIFLSQKNFLACGYLQVPFPSLMMVVQRGETLFFFLLRGEICIFLSDESELINGPDESFAS